MIELTALFMGVAVWLYCLLGGADFGAGILELFTPPEDRPRYRKIINKAIGAVWEANHVWLILALVICFNAFPKAFARISITFHIPVSLLLIGIVLRGCAFTFRHYDPFKDQSQIVYSRFFMLSSLLTPFSLGLTVGGMVLGRVHPDAPSFYQAYVAPWWNPFSFAMGLFVCALFTYLAAVYLVGETSDPDLKTQLVTRAKRWNFLAIPSGGGVILIGWFSGGELFARFLVNPLSLFCVALATLLIVPGWLALNERATWIPRILAGAQFTLILVGWYNEQFPYLLPPSPQFGFAGLGLYDSAAPDTVFPTLLIALGVGGVLIFPALFYLFRVFKIRSLFQ